MLDCTPAHGSKTACLFDLVADPTEHHDVYDSEPEVVARLTAELRAAQATAFKPARGRDDGTACQAALHRWGGKWGPFLP